MTPADQLTDAGEAVIDRVSMAIREEDDRWFSRPNEMIGRDEICRRVDDEREIEVVETAPLGDGNMVMWRLRPNAVARAAIAAMGLDFNSLPPVALHEAMCSGNVKPDTDRQVFFYEQDFYVLSNFSAFSIMWPVSAREGDKRFDTSEAVYHFEKFICRGRVPTGEQRTIAEEIRLAPSAHEAFKIAERNKALRRADWDQIKAGVMKDIIRAKADQHEYVRRKLLATGDRELIEDSWRDDVWGWGPNRDGQNLLGKLWMEVRADLGGAAAPTSQQASMGGSTKQDPTLTQTGEGEDHSPLRAKTPVCQTKLADNASGGEV